MDGNVRPTRTTMMVKYINAMYCMKTLCIRGTRVTDRCGYKSICVRVYGNDR